MNTENLVSVCVTTFKRHNEGVKNWKWVDPFNYEDIEDFNIACKDFFKDEKDPELFFVDWNAPQYLEHLISEFGLALDFYEESEKIQGNFYGTFLSLEDFGEAAAEEFGYFGAIPESLVCYIDFESFGRDLILNGEFKQYGDDYFVNY